MGDIDNVRDAAAAEVIFGPAHLPAARSSASRSYGAQRHPTERKGLP